MTDTHTIVEAPRGPAPVATQKMHPLVGAAVAQGGLDPATLERLMDLQERWEANEAKKAFTRARNALTRDLPAVIRRDKTVAFKNTRYTHTSLAAAMEAVSEPLTQHGFSLSWVPRVEERTVYVTCRLTHTEGHYEEATLSAPPDKSGSKNEAQAVASTTTLLSRYTALLLLGIATADMKEPEGETQERDPNRVDADGNLRAVRAIGAAGLTVADAEAHVGRPVPEWTVKDLGAVKAWIDEQPQEAGA